MATPDTARIASLLATVRACVRRLEEGGLPLDAPLTADYVEHVLVTDPWEAPPGAGDAGTEADGAPRRRRLVMVASELLAALAALMSACPLEPASPHARRGHLRRNPHLLLLCFYFGAPAGGAEGDDAQSGRLRECAAHVLQVLRQLRRPTDGPVDVEYVAPLLRAFLSAWRDYVRLAEAETQTAGGRQQVEDSRRQLFDGSVAALMEVAAAAHRKPHSDDLATLAALLYQKTRSLAASEAELEGVDARLAAVGSDATTATASPEAAQQVAGDTVDEEEGTATAAGTAASTCDVVPAGADDAELPAVLHARSPSLRSELSLGDSLRTAGSADAAAAVGAAAGAARPTFGPPLPPDWYVDEDGRSHPPVGAAEERRRERVSRLQHRAETAYAAALGLRSRPHGPSAAQRAVERTLAELPAQLNQPKPSLRALPGLLAAVQESLLEALPPAARGRMRQQFRDVLDWSIIQKQLRYDPSHIAAVVRFVAGRVRALGAPERDAALAERTEEVCAALESMQPSLGECVAAAFEFLFESIRTLRADVSEFSLLLISDQLRANAVDYVRYFVRTCLPPPPRWDASLSALRAQINTPEVRAWAGRHRDATFPSARDRRLRGAVAHALVALLPSGGRGGGAPADRWAEYPSEMFFFERPVVFQAANAVQQATLQRLLDGTVSGMLVGRGVAPAAATRHVRGLHARVTELLAAPDATVAAVSAALVDGLQGALAAEGRGPLSDLERGTVDGVVRKMIDTESTLYVGFERKTMAVLAPLVLEGAGAADSGDAPELAESATLLRRALAFNWEVYSGMYDTLAPLLQMEE